jgi:hypothetical protein
MRKMKTKVVAYLATFEREVPPIFMHTYPHMVIHIPEQILRWGSARNIWCFFLERYASPTAAPSYVHVHISIAPMRHTHTYMYVSRS